VNNISVSASGEYCVCCSGLWYCVSSVW